MARKIYKARLNLKADDRGTFEAVFARLNVVDHDGDVTLPGAFQQGQRVVIEGWNHDQGLPVGSGHIHSDGREAVVAGRFFLDTTVGRDHYATVKELRPEFSYTFDIVDAERGTFKGERVRFLKRLDVWGVSPVTRGAGIDTGLRTIKARYPFATVPADPKHLLRQLRYITFEAGLDRSDVSKDPSGVKGILDGMLLDAEISQLEAQAKQGDDHQTNGDRLRERVAADWPGASDRYVALQTAAAMAAIVQDVQARDPGLTQAMAEARVAAWARRPV